jgi:hypothetical protein
MLAMEMRVFGVKDFINGVLLHTISFQQSWKVKPHQEQNLWPSSKNPYTQLTFIIMDATSSNLFSSALVKSDAIDPSDDIMNILANSPSSPLVTNTTSLTGKYLSQGGCFIDNIVDPPSANHVNITCLHKHISAPFCLGLICINMNLFCLKTKWTCNFTSHSLASFEMELKHYYIN